jgi:hypothetical protein
VEAPLAVKVTQLVGQMVGLAGTTDTAGKGFTVTVDVAVEVHPAALVPVTV